MILLTGYLTEGATDSAVVSPDEAYCACQAIRRTASNPVQKRLMYGAGVNKLDMHIVAHDGYPFEIHFGTPAAAIILDMTREEALNFADMLWGATRSDEFTGLFSLEAPPRTGHVGTCAPQPSISDFYAGTIDPQLRRDAERRGVIARRMSGESSPPKD